MGSAGERGLARRLPGYFIRALKARSGRDCAGSSPKRVRIFSVRTTNTPDRLATNGIAERESCSKSKKAGTATALVQSGLPGQWWDCATECAFFLRNVHDKMAAGKTALENIFGGASAGPLAICSPRIAETSSTMRPKEWTERSVVGAARTRSHGRAVQTRIHTNWGPGPYGGRVNAQHRREGPLAGQVAESQMGVLAGWLRAAQDRVGWKASEDRFLAL